MVQLVPLGKGCKYHKNEILKLRARDFQDSPYVFVDPNYSYYDHAHEKWHIVLSRCTGEGHFGRFSEAEVDSGTSRTGRIFVADAWKQEDMTLKYTKQELEDAEVALEWLADRRFWRENSGWVYWAGDTPDGNECVGGDPRLLAARVLPVFKELRRQLFEK